MPAASQVDVARELAEHWLGADLECSQLVTGGAVNLVFEVKRPAGAATRGAISSCHARQCSDNTR